MKKFVSKTLFTLCFSLAALSAVYLFRAYQYDELGYPVVDCLLWQDCPESCEKTLPDDAFIAGAIEAVVARQPSAGSFQLDSGLRVSGHILKYENTLEFLDANPACCQFQLGSPRDGVGPIELNRQRLHDYLGYVELTYIRRALLSDGTVHERISTGRQVLMNSCGKAIY